MRAGVGLHGTAVFRSANKIRSSIRTRRKQPVTLARRSFRAPASGEVRLNITLSRRSFRILQLNRRIRTRATVTLRNAAGLSSTASKQITLKAPKRRALHLRRRAYTIVKSVDIASRP